MTGLRAETEHGQVVGYLAEAAGLEDIPAGFGGRVTLDARSVEGDTLPTFPALGSIGELRVDAAARLRDFAALAAAHSLSVLALSRLPAGADLAALGALHGLVSLSLQAPSLDLRPLASLIALESLELRLGELRDLTPLASLSRLRTLTLAGRAADLSPLGALLQLRVVDASALTGAPDFSPLSSLRDLERLIRSA